MQELSVRLPPKWGCGQGSSTAREFAEPGEAQHPAFHSGTVQILLHKEKLARMFPVVVTIMATAQSKEGRIVPRRFGIPNSAFLGVEDEKALRSAQSSFLSCLVPADCSLHSRSSKPSPGGSAIGGKDQGGHNIRSLGGWAVRRLRR